jgi:hypothetical protein
VLSALLAGCAPEDPDPLEGLDAAFTFGVMGDVPYSARSEARFPELVASLEARAPAFVIHVGDVKGGSVACSDSLLAQRRDALAEVDLPLVYLPGDNEWTDCHRTPPGAHDPLERLDALRALFYPTGGSATVGGRAMAVEQQADDPAWREFLEHQRWRREGVVFATLHVVGSRNGLGTFDGRTEAHDAEVRRRTDAALAWMRETFEQAVGLGAPAVVLAIHGNPWEAPWGAGRTGFEELLEALAAEARAWGRPVLLVHGDTHTFRVDRPLDGPDGEPVENVTRLETYGEPDVGWVEVAVQPGGDPVFTVAGREIS